MRIRDCLFILASGFVAVGCGIPHLDGSTQEGKAAVLDAVHSALTNGNCSKAISLIEPVYNSVYSDNEVRLARASAFACAAGVDNFFQLAANMATNPYQSTPGQGSFLFRTAAKLFNLPGLSFTDYDDRLATAQQAMEALTTVIREGVFVRGSNAYLTTTPNTGSYLATDRTDDSNLYMMMVSLSAMGAVGNRYGNPYTTNFKKGNLLGIHVDPVNGWRKATQMQGAACTYVAGFLNFVDSVGVVLPKLSGNLATSLNVFSGLTPTLDALCNAGCKGIAPTSTGCNIAAGCATCPIELRDYASCTGLATNPASCAGAALIDFINNDTTTGWVTGP